MATIKIPPVLRPSVGGEKEVQAAGDDVGAVLTQLAEQHPATQSQLFGADGALNRYVNVYLNDEDVRVLDGLGTSVKDGDTLVILPAMAGGCRVTLTVAPAACRVSWPPWPRCRACGRSRSVRSSTSGSSSTCATGGCWSCAWCGSCCRPRSSPWRSCCRSRRRQLDLARGDGRPGRRDAFFVAQGHQRARPGRWSTSSPAACFKAVADAYLGTSRPARRSLSFGLRRVPRLLALYDPVRRSRSSSSSGARGLAVAGHVPCCCCADPGRDLRRRVVGSRRAAVRGHRAGRRRCALVVARAGALVARAQDPPRRRAARERPWRACSRGSSC